MTGRELILVEMNDGSTCRMAKKALKVFLARGGIKRFKRTDGWFVVGRDQARDPKNDRNYNGVERREVI